MSLRHIDDDCSGVSTNAEVAGEFIIYLKG